MLNLITAGLGAAGGIMNALEAKKRATDMFRIEEDYNRQGAATLAQAKERTLLQNPMAAAQQQRADINASQNAAVGAALNQVAGQNASSGDFGNAMASGIQGAQAVQAAAAPANQQLAQVTQNAMAGRQQQDQAVANIGTQQADLSKNVSYIQQQRENMPNTGMAILQGLTGALGGGNLASSLGQLFQNNEDNPDPTGGVQPPGTGGGGMSSVQGGASAIANPTGFLTKGLFGMFGAGGTEEQQPATQQPYTQPNLIHRPKPINYMQRGVR
jgi:hypothetical protein